MLKVNKEYISTACSELKKCSCCLNYQVEQLEEVYSYLKNNPSLEDEAAALMKSINEMNAEMLKISNLIKVLDYAAYEYELCEERIIDLTESIRKAQSKGLKFKKTIFRFNFNKTYSWR